MQTIKTIFFITLIFTSFHSFGSEGSKDTKLLSIIVIKKYTKEFTEIYKNNEEIFCKTEINPRFYILKKNKEAIIASYIKELKKKEAQVDSECNSSADPMMLTVEGESIKICSSKESVKKILQQLAKDCGRSF